MKCTEHPVSFHLMLRRT